MSLGKFVKRLFTTSPVAPLAKVGAAIGIGFALGPAGVGFGSRVLQGFGSIPKRIGGAVGGVAHAVEGVLQSDQQQSAQPGFDQQRQGVYPLTGYPRQTQRPYRNRYGGQLPDAGQQTNLGGSNVSMIGNMVGGALLRKVGFMPTSGFGGGGMAGQLMPLPGSGFSTGGGFGGGFSPALTRRGTTGGGGFPTAGDHPYGYHWSRRTGQLVKNRRMNPCNPHALRRAMRRVEGFGKLIKRYEKIMRKCAPRHHAHHTARPAYSRKRK